MGLKEGMYVRNDKGFISQIIEFKEHYTKGKRLVNSYSIKEVIENYLLLKGNQCEFIESIDYSIPPCYPSDEELEKIKSHIVKASNNIIDLIEVGDYVNGIRVDVIENGQLFNYNSYDGWKVNITPIYNEKISIVTKEQFESISYRVEDK